MSEFLKYYPGKYNEREKPWIDAYIETNAAIERRGPVNIPDLIAGRLPPDTPGVGVITPVKEDMARYVASKYAYEEPLYNDRDYARAAGFPDLPVLPTYAAADDAYVLKFPYEMRDRMWVAGLNHSVKFFRPICVGDTLYHVVDERHFTDLTPLEGAEQRTLALNVSGSVYNQRGEKVCAVNFRSMHNMVTYADQSAKPANIEPRQQPDWWRHEDHVYTDADWDFIRAVWSREFRRGSEPLYWEDVNVGDQPAWTLDGPVDDTCDPTLPYGCGTGGSRTLKKEIMDPALFKTLVRNPYDGIYRFPNRRDMCPRIPEYARRPDAVNFDEFVSSMDEPPHRFIFINFMGRDYALRHINNWMGDHGRLRAIKWTIMTPETVAKFDYPVIRNPEAESFLDDVPILNGRKATCHGLERDIMLVKSYVTRKYSQNGEFLVDLAWWIECITGEIFEEGRATVALPSRDA